MSIRVGDYGTVFTYNVKDTDGSALLIPSNAVKAVTFRKPGGTLLEVTPAFTTDGTDGSLQYVAVEGDLDESGLWETEARVEFGGGRWTTTRKTFMVGDLLEAQ